MIFVTGCARSGTSLATQMLGKNGCSLGSPGSVNSLFENVRVRQDVLKPYLAAIGADPLGQHPLPKHSASFQEVEGFLPVDIRKAVDAHVRGEPRAYKDAKLTLVWPLFDAAFPRAKWVIVRRNKESIVDSCVRTPFMRAYGSDRAGWEKWVNAHERRFKDMLQELDAIEVWMNEVVNKPEAFSRVTDHCGLEFNLIATKSCIEKKAWHETES